MFSVSGVTTTVFNETFTFEGSFQKNLGNCTGDALVDVSNSWNITRVSASNNKIVALDNDWYCTDHVGGDGNMVYQNWSDPLYYVKIPSLYYRVIKPNTVACSSPVNCRSSIIHFFDNPIDFEQGSYFEFYCANVSEANTDHYLHLRTDSPLSGFSINLDGGTSATVGSSANQCAINNVSFCSGNTMNKVRITYENITSCRDPSDLQDLTSIEFRSVFGNGIDETFFLDEMVIVAEQNLLPSFNVSFINACYNNSIGVAEVYYNITAYDPDNDTILYSVNEIDYAFRYYYIDEKLGLGNGNPDYSFFDHVITNFTIAKTSDQIYQWDDKEFLKQQGFPNTPYHIYKTFGGTIGLVTDLRNSRWSYHFDDPLRNSSTITFNLGIIQEETQITIEPINSFGQGLINITLNQTNNNLSVFIDGNKAYNHVTTKIDSSGNTQDLLTVIFALDMGNNIIRTAIMNLTDTFVNNDSTVTFDDVSGFRISGVDRSSDNLNYYWFDNLNVRGWNYIPSIKFEDSATGFINVSDKTTYYLDFYVTDTQHDNLTYSYKREPLSIIDCKFYLEESSKPLDKDEGYINFFKTYAGNPLRKLIIDNGWDTTFSSFLWIFWFLMFLFMVGSEFMLLRKIDVVFPMLSSSALFFIIAMLLSYTIQAITFLIFIALSGAILIGPSFLGGHKHGTR